MTLAPRTRWNLRNCSSLAVWATTVAEAAVMLAGAAVLVRLGLRRAAPWVFTVRRPDDARPDHELERRLGRCVQAVARLLRWKHCCLPVAIAVKAMLARRGFPSTIHLGAGRGKSGLLHAHAWVEAGGPVIAGEDYIHTVTPLVRSPSGRPGGRLAP